MVRMVVMVGMLGVSGDGRDNQGLIQSSNLGVGRVMPSRGSTRGAAMSGAKGQIFKIVDNSGQFVPAFLSKY